MNLLIFILVCFGLCAVGLCFFFLMPLVANTLLALSTAVVGDLVKSKFGLQLAFHPCADTHVEYQEQILTFLSDTDPDLVTLCLDTGHHAYRFGDPVVFMREHHERIGYLHLKSVDFEIREQINKDEVAFMDAVK